MVKKKQYKPGASSNILFPPSLEHKKISINTISSKKSDKEIRLDEKISSCLSDYLITKNPMSFVYAIKNKPELVHNYLAGKGTSLDMDLYQKVKDVLDKSHTVKVGNKTNKKERDEIKISYRHRKYIDLETVIRETLNWWREMYNFSGIYTEAKIVRKYLEKIAPFQIFNRNETVIVEGGEYLIHIDEKKKHPQQCVTYISPTEFISRWEKVYSAFDKFRSKIRYKTKEDALKKADALKAIHFLGNELSDHEVNYLDLTNTMTMTASYIRLYHEDRCSICKKEGLNDKTIIRSLYEAHQELNRISNP